MLIRLATILTILILSGCAKPLSQFSVTQGFNSQAFKNGNMTFLGLTSSDFNKDEADRYSELAWLTLSKNLEDKNKGKVPYLLHDLGNRDDYIKIQSEFARSHHLTEESVAEITSTPTKPRYVMFTSLTLNTTSDNQVHVENKLPDGKMEKGTRYTATRRIVVATEIFDLATSSVVLTGTTPSAFESSNFVPHGDDRAFFKDLFREIARDATWSTATPMPRLEILLERAFKDISQSLSDAH